jgi:hypothetical protein
VTTAPKKTSRNTSHGAPSPNDDPNEDGTPISEVDLANKKTKLILELVNQRKKVEMLHKDILKRIKEHVMLVIAMCDERILTKEVQIAQQMALIKTYKVRLSSKEETFKAQKKALLIKHDTAVALLEAQMDWKKKEAIMERSKALNVGRDLSNANKKSGKLQADVLKSQKNYDNLSCKVCDSKLVLTRVKKELTSTKKKILEKLDLTLAHKECIKDKEIRKEQIKYNKETKESSLYKLLSQERNHANTLTHTKHCYDKAKKVNFD